MILKEHYMMLCKTNKVKLIAISTVSKLNEKTLIWNAPKIRWMNWWVEGWTDAQVCAKSSTS